MDLLFIGKIQSGILKNILSVILKKHGGKLKIHTQVFNLYYFEYKTENKYFNKIIDRFEIKEAPVPN